MGLFSYYIFNTVSRLNKLTKVGMIPHERTKTTNLKPKVNNQDLYKLIGKTIFNQCGTYVFNNDY